MWVVAGNFFRINVVNIFATLSSNYKSLNIQSCKLSNPKIPCSLTVCFITVTITDARLLADLIQHKFAFFCSGRLLNSHITAWHFVMNAIFFALGIVQQIRPQSRASTSLPLHGTRLIFGRIIMATNHGLQPMYEGCDVCLCILLFVTDNTPYSPGILRYILLCIWI